MTHVYRDEITPVLGGLYQSGLIHDWGDMVSQAPDLNIVIDVAKTSGHEPVGFPREPGYLYVHWPMYDPYPGSPDHGLVAPLPPTGKLWALARFVSSLLDDDNKVLVHCKGGKNRSGLVLGAVLIERLNWPGYVAVDWLREHRPGSLQNEEFADYLCGNFRAGEVAA